MIEFIGLRNFKAFDEIELELGTLTLLSGLNGSGKSTVIQALGILRQSFDANFLLEGDLVLNGELLEIGTGRDVLYHRFDLPEITLTLGARQGDKELILSWKADVSTDVDILTCYEKPENDDLLLLHLFDRGFQFLRADRITPSVTFPKSQHAVHQRRFLGPRGEYTAHFLLEFGEETGITNLMRWPGEPDTASLAGQVNAWMQELSPGVRVEAARVPMTDLVRLVYSYKGEGAAYGEALRPTNAGFGLTHALPIITACLAAAPGSLLIVENPEAQLHPRGQAAIGRLLALTAAGGVQVIMESHSDHVLNGIRLAVKEGALLPELTRLHFFSSHFGQGSSCESPVIGADGRLSYWPADFFDQWEKSLDRLLDD